MKKAFMYSLIVMILMAGCKKQSPEITLKGKWNLENVITKEYNNGVLTNTNTQPGGGTTYDFQANGNLVIKTFFGADHPYTIISDSKVKIDGDIFDIRNLTSSQVTLFIRTDYTNQYNEQYINLKK
jgi:hypothetical protein